MLWALVDYVRYRFNLGRYSTDALRDHKARLLDQEWVIEDDAFHRGYLFVMHTKGSFLSWAVMYYTDSIWSHAGWFSEDSMIIDATTSGLIEHPIADYADGTAFMRVFPMRVPPEVSAYMVDKARSRLGLPYDWPGTIKICLYVLSAKHHAWKLHHSLDLLAVLFIFWCLTFSIQFAHITIAVIALLYAVLVLYNLAKRQIRAA